MRRFPLLLCVVFVTALPLLADDARDHFEVSVRRVAQHLIRIETIGGTSTVGTNAATTTTSDAAVTGVLLDTAQHRDGKMWSEAVTSAYPFRHRPSAILVRLADGSSHAARLVATDQTRMVSLLTWESLRETRLAALSVAERPIGLGKAVATVGLLHNSPYTTRGIVSGTRRLWGKAIQTDAAVSPMNYGGLLLDMHGGAIGLLVPLALTEEKLFEGSDFYDSGIGFAIPWSDIVDRIVPRLRDGRDLHASATGIVFAPSAVWTGAAAVVTAVEPQSRGAVAGITAGDNITAIDGHAVTQARDAAFLFAERYAEDTIQITVRRGESEITIVLAAASVL